MQILFNYLSAFWSEPQSFTKFTAIKTETNHAHATKTLGIN